MCCECLWEVAWEVACDTLLAPKSNCMLLSGAGTVCRPTARSPRSAALCRASRFPSIGGREQHTSLVSTSAVDLLPPGYLSGWRGCHLTEPGRRRSLQTTAHHADCTGGGVGVQLSRGAGFWDQQPPGWLSLACITCYSAAGNLLAPQTKLLRTLATAKASIHQRICPPQCTGTTYNTSTWAPVHSTEKIA
jgi:hypothetical protein